MYCNINKSNINNRYFKSLILSISSFLETSIEKSYFKKHCSLNVSNASSNCSELTISTPESGNEMFMFFLKANPFT